MDSAEAGLAPTRQLCSHLPLSWLPRQQSRRAKGTGCLSTREADCPTKLGPKELRKEGAAQSPESSRGPKPNFFASPNEVFSDFTPAVQVGSASEAEAMQTPVSKHFCKPQPSR